MCRVEAIDMGTRIQSSVEFLKSVRQTVKASKDESMCLVYE